MRKTTHTACARIAATLLLLSCISCGPRFTSEVKATGTRPFLALEALEDGASTRVLLLTSESPDLCSLGQSAATRLFVYEGSWREAGGDVDCSGIVAATFDDLTEILQTDVRFAPKMIYPLVEDVQGRVRLSSTLGEVTYYLGGDQEYLQVVRGEYGDAGAVETEHLYSLSVLEGKPIVQTERHMDREIGR